MSFKCIRRMKQKLLEKTMLETYTRVLARIPLESGDPPWREQVNKY